MAVYGTRDIHDYEDIIHMEHPLSVKHPPMAREKRAIQFAPFAALSGYGDLVDETARLTETKKELDWQQRESLDRKLQQLQQHIEEKPVISVVYFQHDAQKDGGAYLIYSGVVRRIDPVDASIRFEDGMQIALEDLFEMEGPVDFFQ